MSKFNKGQNSFRSGEISDRAKGRVDLEEYHNACDRVENFIPQRQGGAVKRPGMRYVASLGSDASFVGDRLIPFSFSKNENFILVINNFSLGGEQFKVFNADGTQPTVPGSTVSINTEGFHTIDPEYTGYDSKNWKFSQSGDLIFLTYSEPNQSESRIPPALFYRDGEGVFNIVTFSDPDEVGNLPEVGIVNPTLNRPYLDPNTNPAIRLHVDSIAIGTAKLLKAVDASNLPIPFFKEGHAFRRITTGAPRDQVGAFFKVQLGSDEGVAYGSDWRLDIVEASANINTGTDVLTSTGHGLTTRDRVTIKRNLDSSLDNPVIADYPLDTTTGEYGIFYVRAINVNELAFYENQADADADSNRIDFTAAGTDGIRLYHYQLNVIGCTIEVEMPAGLTSSAGASDNWQESAWSFEQGFPRSVVFHEQRAYFGGTAKRPDTVWASQVGNIYNFMSRRLEQDITSPTLAADTLTKLPFILSGDVTATDPFSFTIASKQANIIQWMESQRSLLIGTLGAEYTVDGGDSIISNESIFVKKQTEYGSNNTEAISLGNSALFISRDGRRVRNFQYNRNNGSFVSVNLSILADHMVFRGFDGASTSTLKDVEFTEMYHQPSRDVIWLLTSNNELVGITISKETEVQAWHYHKTREGDSIRSICVLPSADGTFDEVFVIVRRSINGSSLMYLEKMGDDFEHDVLNNTSASDEDTAWYTDSSVKYSLPINTDIVAGLTHLIGETVDVLAGDAIEKGLVVNGSGEVTLSQQYPSGTVCIAGLRYKSKLRTVDIEAGGDFGNSQGTRQRIDRVAMRLYRSQGGEYGNQNQATLFPLEYDDNNVVTEIRRLSFEITADMDNQFLIEHDDPTPFNVLSLTFRGVSFD